MIPRNWLIATSLIIAAGSVRADDARQRDEELLREAGVGVEGPSLIAFFRDRTPTEQQRTKIETLIQQFASDSFRERKKALAELESLGMTALGMLKQSQLAADPEIARQCELLVRKIEKVPSEVVAAAAARLLARTRPPGTVELILAQLPSADNENVAEALRESLSQVALRDGKPEAALMAALKDGHPARRGAAAEALLKNRVKAVEPQIRALLHDKDAMVRLRTAYALVTVLRDKDVMPLLIRQLSDAPPGEIWHVEETLRHLAGEDAPAVSLAGEYGERQRARDAWADWWAKAGPGIDLKKLDEAPKSLGYTLVCQVNPNVGDGEVKEFAPDGKTVRWRVRNLSMPIDAQYLPQQNRLLIAEYNGTQVSERDLDGKIIKQWPINNPVACQRLPDGKTFIAFRAGLIEYDAKGTRVFGINRNASDIVTARKARDGTYVYVTRIGQCERINAQGTVLKSFPVGRMYTYSDMSLLPNNRILVSQLTGVAEYDLATGKLEWSATWQRNPTSVDRLDNGNTLVSSSSTRKIVELDREGKIVREITLPDGAIPWRVRRR